MYSRPEEPFFLATPEADADGRRSLTPLFEQAHRFHHHRRPGGVVGGAGAGVP
jgi:hypothetical protein